MQQLIGVLKLVEHLHVSLHVAQVCELPMHLPYRARAFRAALYVENFQGAPRHRAAAQVHRVATTCSPLLIAPPTPYAEPEHGPEKALPLWLQGRTAPSCSHTISKLRSHNNRITLGAEGKGTRLLVEELRCSSVFSHCSGVCHRGIIAVPRIRASGQDCSSCGPASGAP
jgi:hypothetical protein